MSGSFTLTGKLMHHDKVTPHADEPIVISADTYKDTTDKVIYTEGATAVTDADGSFSISLLTEAGLSYTVTSGSSPALFAPITFVAPTAGSTVDITNP